MSIMVRRVILTKNQPEEKFKNFITEITEDMETLTFILCITHLADLDGLFSALLVNKREFTRNIIIIAIDNADDEWLKECINKIFKAGINVQRLYVTDIGLQDETHEYIHEFIQPTYMYYIDHHQSALSQKKLLDTLYDEVIIDTNYCAAYNCFTYLRISDHLFEEYQRYIMYVNDRDLFLRKYPVSDDLNYLYKILGFHRMFDLILNDEKIIDDNGSISDKYSFIIDIEKKKIVDDAKIFINNIKKVDLNYGVVFGYALYTGRYASDIAEYFRNNTPEHLTDIDVLAFIFNDSVSLRVVNNSDFNVAKFAKARGGGGHPKAAGYPLDSQKLLTNEFLASLIR